MAFVFVTRPEALVNVSPDCVQKVQAGFTVLADPPVKLGEVAHEVFQGVGTELVVYPVRIAGRASVTAEATLFQDEVGKHVGQNANGLWPRRQDPVSRKRINRAQNFVNRSFKELFGTPSKLRAFDVNRAERRHKMQEGNGRVDSKCWAAKVQFL